MDYFEKIMRLYRELTSRRYPVPISTLSEILDCTERNTKNIITKLRDAGAPIVYDREHHGYILDRQDGNTFELPGLWFNPTELHALMASHQLLSEVQPGWLNDYIQPLKDRIEKLLDDAARDFQEVQKRVRILQIAARPTKLDEFQKATEALIGRKQLHILYHARTTDKTTERTVSPQRLVYYRSNWYLDAWCHWRTELRTFAIDRLHVVELRDEPAREVDETDLDRHYAATYGLFAGDPEEIAHLRFSPQAAKWVADEQWHPEEQGTVQADGGYELKLPYSDPTELVMEILKYGPEVEVIGPSSLRERVAHQLREATARYTVKK